jgi:hypothetical protein
MFAVNAGPVSVLVVSVAVIVQATDGLCVVIFRVVKDASPFAAVIGFDGLPLMVHPALPVISMWSVAPVLPVVSTLPYWSSIQMENVSDVPLVVVVGGATSNTSWLGAAGVTVVAGVLVAVVRALEESAAVSVQEPTLVIVTALKVATPPTPTTESVPPSVQLEVRAIVSVEPVPVVTTLP